MINDPYQVLGISPGANTDEIKKAYRKKAKECHPDLHPNDPSAHVKMQQVNEAYDMLMNPAKHQAHQQRQQNRQSTSQSSGYSQQGGSYYQNQTHRQQEDPFNPFRQQGSGGWQSDDWFSFEDIFGFGRQQQSANIPPPHETVTDNASICYIIRNINSNNYSAAYNALNNVPSTGRNARWYYLSSLTNKGLGNDVAALEQIQRAVQLDPNNQLYHQILQQYRSSTHTYEENARNYNSGSFDPGKICLGLCAANMLCNCFFCR